MVLVADRADLAGADGVALVAPGVVDVGQHVGDLGVGEHGLLRGHDAVEGGAVDRDRAGQALEHDADGAFLVGEQEVGAGERGKGAGQALAVGLVAGEAQAHENLLALLGLHFLGEAGDGRVGLDFLGDAALELGLALGGLGALFGLGAEVDGVDLLAGVDHAVLRPGDLKHAERALVEGTGERVVDEDEGAGHVDLELHRAGAAGRHERGLHVAVGQAQTGLGVDLVEDLADDVER